MNKLGTVFSVINLGLVAVFVGSMASLIGTSGEYRSKWETDTASLRAELQAEKEGRAQDQARISEQDRQLSDARGTISRTQAELKVETEKRLAAEQRIAELTATINPMSAKLGDLEQAIRMVTTRNTELTREMEQLRSERDAALDKADAAAQLSTQAGEARQMAEKRLSDAEAMLARVTEERDSFRAQLLRAAQEFNFEPSRLGVQPLDLEGVVLQASYEGNTPVIVINKGRNDRIQPGYTFDVYGGSAYKGQIRVSSVNDNNSSATVVRAGTARIAAGDRFRTNL